MLVQEPTYLAQRGPRSEQGKSLHLLLDDYLQYHRIQGSTRDTLKHKQVQLGLFIKSLEANGHSMLVEDLSRTDVQRHLGELIEAGRKPATVNTRFRSIRAWANWLVEWDITPEPFTKGLKTPRVPLVYKPFLVEQEIDRILALCPDNTFLGARRQALVKLLITSGLRRSELANIQLADLNWEGETIRVMGKGQKERAVTFLRPYVQKAMLKYLQHRRRRFNDELEALWVTEEGGILTARGISKDLITLEQKAGISKQDSCHIFRRSWAKWSIENQLPAGYIRARAGWTTNRMLEHYTRGMELDEAAATEAYRSIRAYGDHS